MQSDDHALVRDQELLSADALQARAHGLLTRHVGPSEAAVQTAFASGALSMLSDHTHYSNGFALLVPVAQGTAVAVRPARTSSSHAVSAGKTTACHWDPTAPSSAEGPLWVRILAHTADALAPGLAVDIGVTSTLADTLGDTYQASVAVAAARAVLAHVSERDPDADPPDVLKHLPALRQALATATSLPFSIAFPIAAAAGGDAGPFTLVDTATHEHLPVETVARDALAWVLIDPKRTPRDAAFHRHRRDQADEAIALLRERAFGGLASFRELEHQNIPQAIDTLPSRLTPVVRHLVTDNRRVQKMVAAMRRSDWQMVGALLLMSHASRRTEWECTTPEADFIVDHVEERTVNGLYGACMTGRSGYVLLVGQPHAVTLAVEPLQEAFEERFGRPLSIAQL
jgi:galactokinase